MCLVELRLNVDIWFWLFGSVVGMLFMNMWMLCMLKVVCELKLWIEICLFCV